MLTVANTVSPFPIAMLFTVTEEIKCTLEPFSQNNIAPGVDSGEGGGGGANLFPLDTMVVWREIENCFEMPQHFIRGCRLFCGGSEKSRFQSLHKEQCQNFLEFYVRGIIYCFFDKVLIITRQSIEVREYARFQLK